MEKLIQAYLQEAKKFDAEYLIDSENEEAIIETLKYFFTDGGKFDKTKALYLYGSYGSGKTVLFHVMNKLLGSERFRYTKAIKIANDFRDYGGAVLDHYKKAEEILIDDVGEEETAKNFGNSVNVIGEVLSFRYEKWQQRKVRTHISTNVKPSDFAEQYGERIGSRLAEQYNFVKMVGEDRRKTAKAVAISEEQETKPLSEDEKQKIEDNFMSEFWEQPFNRFCKSGNLNEFDGEKMHQVFKILYKRGELTLTPEEVTKYRESGFDSIKEGVSSSAWELRVVDRRTMKLLDEETAKKTYDWMVRFNSALLVMQDYIIEKSMGI